MLKGKSLHLLSDGSLFISLGYKIYKSTNLFFLNKDDSKTFKFINTKTIVSNRPTKSFTTYKHKYYTKKTNNIK
jgi:hypothetical protein